MASVLDLVKHYQTAIEKYPHDEQKVLKCIDKLFNLGVTVQHLQETGVGRTVNALRKEPGEVGQAARSLVYKWKLMVAAEESDTEEQTNDTSTYNGHGSGKDSDDNAQRSRSNSEKYEKPNSVPKEKELKDINGSYSGSKRKYHSSEEEDAPKRRKHSSSSEDDYNRKSQSRSRNDESESESTDNSQSDESDSDVSDSSHEEVKVKQEIKKESTSHHKSSSSKHSSHSEHSDNKNSIKRSHDTDKDTQMHSSQPKDNHEVKSSSRDKGSSSVKQSNHSSSKQSSHTANKHSSHSSDKHSSHSSDRHKSSKDKESNSEKKHKDHRTDVEKSHKESKPNKHSSSSNAERHKSSSSQKTDSGSDKHKSSSDKHSKSDKNKSSSHSHSSEKEKPKSSSERESSKHKSKESTSNGTSSTERQSSNKDKSKDRSSSSKEKSSNEKKHSSSSEHKSNEQKSSSSSSKEKSSEKKSSHKSSSSHKNSLKSSSSSSKEEAPKKKVQINDEGGDSDDGIDCGSGASFAEALGMISPAKSKKKGSGHFKDSTSPNYDLSPATLLAPSAKLAPLPALEISGLPEISPNYKPRPPPRPLPHFSDEDAMNMTISSKNQRTKVYSGNKVIGKVPSLYEICVHVLQEHINALEFTGGVPYEILKPIVDKATPQQLYMLEHYNNYLMDDTDHLWQAFCQKHFRNKQRQELETWREMYARCQEEQEHKLKSLTANIRIAQEAKKAPIKQTKMAYVDSVAKPPRNIAKKQAAHGTARLATGSPAARVAALAGAPHVLRGGAGARCVPAPAASGSSAFQKPKKAPLMAKALQIMRGRKR